ncbi:phenylacetic acid degradation B [Alicyclobacillus hesperidum URH17-3-68]|uniref:Cytosine deaminase n=1 Tax=Alicyclobacillus hesperidum TaxID=89784 RepID=A0AA37U871_9BACL|nr:cytosine deaminase [Alicyclobacillus hesperidum]EJY55406.1 phenylacetic acid degradation B [Alicyclobacillus hesperidum URH17-3-68]GLV13197.1 cytosine deaminase [Alicyclobacillus hesperidum]
MSDVWISDVRIMGREGKFDIGVQGGHIAEIVTAGTRTYSGQVIEGRGLLAMPPFVEPHVHLDSVLTAGQPRWNESGTLFEGIQRWSERKPYLTREDVLTRVDEALQWMMAQGTLHIRTHVDVTDPTLTALQALLELREKVRGVVDIQIVAFPQEGIYSYQNGRGLELLEEALRLGADVVGAIPHYEYTREYGVRSIDACFDLAEKYDRLVDVHCDEIDDEQSRFVEVVATRALERGMGQRVTASHTTAMGSYNDAYAYKLFGLLRKADIHFIANPLINITLQGRFDSYPKRRGFTRVKELWQAGINVCLGHDDIMDPWYSFGTGSMLQVAHMAMHVGQMTGRQEAMACVDMVTYRSAKTLQIEDRYGIEVGKPASLLLVDADDKWDLLRRMPPAELVMSHGMVVAKTDPVKRRVYWTSRDGVVGEGGYGVDFRMHTGSPVSASEPRV